MKEYVIVVDGIEHTVQASDEDAKARGLVPAKQADPPANKARGAKNKKG